MPPASEHPTDRRRVVALAGHTGDEATARDALVDADPAVRATALGALHRLHVLTLGEVKAAVTDTAPAVRSRAAELAAQFGADGESLVVAATDDDDPFVVEAACFALGEMGDRASRPSIDRLSRITTDHTDPMCREAAVAALGAIGQPAGLAAILAATNDKPAVRRRAVLALAPFEGANVDAALERALADRDWQVRQAAEDLTYRAGDFTS